MIGCDHKAKHPRQDSIDVLFFFHFSYYPYQLKCIIGNTINKLIKTHSILAKKNIISAPIPIVLKFVMKDQSCIELTINMPKKNNLNDVSQLKIG